MALLSSYSRKDKCGMNRNESVFSAPQLAAGKIVISNLNTNNHGLAKSGKFSAAFVKTRAK